MFVIYAGYYPHINHLKELSKYQSNMAIQMDITTRPKHHKKPRALETITQDKPRAC